MSFEWDYVNVLTLLRLAQIPRYATERNHHHQSNEGLPGHEPNATNLVSRARQ